jgi:hypothetical protein
MQTTRDLDEYHNQKRRHHHKFCHSLQVALATPVGKIHPGDRATSRRQNCRTRHIQAKLRLWPEFGAALLNPDERAGHACRSQRRRSHSPSPLVPG